MNGLLWLLIGVTTQLMLKLVWMKDPPRGPWYTWVAAALGGLVGGWLYQTAWPVEGAMSGVQAAASGVGAVIGATALLFVAHRVSKPQIPD